jgi:formyltetrahydrofolate-dependent phosphoribosylglycinamide formyltransferase
MTLDSVHTRHPLRIAVLLSGGGTTLQNLIDRIDRRELDATIQCVVASRPDAHGLERARKHSIPAATVTRKAFSTPQTFSGAVWEALGDYELDLVVLAGFMSWLDIPPAFVNRVINVHGALIPAFCGKGMYGEHVHQAVIEYGVKVTGVTVHFADGEYDHGPIILQAPVPVLDGDTPDSLAARIQAKERELYPQAIQLIAEGRDKVEGRRVRIL